MTASHHECPIWGTKAEVSRTNFDGDSVCSPRAGGRYEITRNAAVDLRWASDQTRTLLTSWIIEQHRFGIEAPRITVSVVKELEHRQMPTVFERADNLLRYLESKSQLIGSNFRFHSTFNLVGPDRSSTEIPAADAYEILAWTGSTQLSEISFLIGYCDRQEWVSYSRSSSGQGVSFSVTLTATGYARLAELGGAVLQSDQGFVAMWFDSSTDKAYEHGIKPGIKKAGYTPTRIDNKEHNNKIDDEIVAEIRRSRFLVADFTQAEGNARGGVYYEAGFAHGLNIPVIFTYREDAIGFVHFDTRQYNHITWTTPDELQDKLAKRISATIGDGPHIGK